MSTRLAHHNWQNFILVAFIMLSEMSYDVQWLRIAPMGSMSQ